MIDSETMTETGTVEEMGPKQMRIGEVGANQGTAGKDTPEIVQGRITGHHTTERVAEIGEIWDQGREK